MLSLTLLFAALALFPSPSGVICQADASHGTPADFCYQTDIAITYTGSGTVTNQPVRVELNALGMVGAGQMDPRAWDIRPMIGSYPNEPHITAQSMASSTAPFWIIVPEISQNQTRTVRTYSGSGELHRDQSVYFTGGEYLSAADHADFDITNNLRLDVSLVNFSDTARTDVLASHFNASAGYYALLRDNASVLEIFFGVDGSSCALTWSSAWTGVRQDFRFEYISAPGADTFIYRNGVLEASCDTDVGALGAATTDLFMGSWEGATGLASDVAISTVEISAAGVTAGRWSFDAPDTAETVATSPFAGTVADLSGNGHTATYTFTRPQADWTYTVGTTQLVSLAGQITLADSNPDVLGPAFGLDITPRAEVTTGAFYTVFLDKWADASPVRSFGYAAALSAIGLLMAVGVYRLTRYIPLALFMFGFPFAIGVTQGWIPPWFMILWVILAIGGWFAQRQSETA